MAGYCATAALNIKIDNFFSYLVMYWYSLWEELFLLENDYIKSIEASKVADQQFNTAKHL